MGLAHILAVVDTTRERTLGREDGANGCLEAALAGEDIRRRGKLLAGVLDSRQRQLLAAREHRIAVADGVAASCSGVSQGESY